MCRRLDVLVNNAGLERITPADDASPEALALFRRILDINVTGMAIVTAQALGAMGRARGSSTPPRSGAGWASRSSAPTSPRSMP
jgi:NAD(P)-dependent dehydrogenase (short-subunit alcohol dehydrogenase family)